MTQTNLLDPAILAGLYQHYPGIAGRGDGVAEQTNLLNWLVETFPETFRHYADTPAYEQHIRALEAAKTDQQRAEVIRSMAFDIKWQPEIGLNVWLEQQRAERQRTTHRK